jgi:O-antigen/teichoic acid export membrane protein
LNLSLSTPLLIATAASGVFSYAALAINGRVLGPSDFGLLGAMVGIVSFGAVALRPVSLAATHHVIIAPSVNGARSVRELVTLGALVAVVLSLPLLAIAIVASGPLDGLLHASGRWPVALLGPYLALVVGQQIVSGALLGGHRLPTQALAACADACARAVVTFPAALIFGVSGAFAAYLVGQCSSIATAVIALGGVAWFRSAQRDVLASGRVGLASVSLVLGTALLQYGDLIVLRWYGQPDDAGQYAACAGVGALLVAISVPIYLPSFPRAVTARRDRLPTRPILLSTLLLVLGLGLGAAFLSEWFGGLVLRASFGAQFEAASLLLPLYLIKTSLVVAVGVLGQHALALKATRSVNSLFPVSAGALLAVAVLQPSPTGVVLAVGAGSALLGVLLMLEISSMEGASRPSQATPGW